ncbi:hypothetical protein VTK56DRAFT_6390 [Thermocarpiscus australiensis]
MAAKPADRITSGLTKLSLDTATVETTKATAARPKPQTKTTAVADSWEDEAEADDDAAAANESASDAEATPVGNSVPGTSAPPPTPLSPLAHNEAPLSPPSALPGPLPGFSPHDGSGQQQQQQQQLSTAGLSRRPEKTDAVARRMIASALGMKAPKPTEEQRAYDRAVREKERKRREEERERERRREEEIARARQAIWED